MLGAPGGSGAAKRYPDCRCGRPWLARSSAGGCFAAKLPQQVRRRPKALTLTGCRLIRRWPSIPVENCRFVPLIHLDRENRNYLLAGLLTPTQEPNPDRNPDMMSLNHNGLTVSSGLAGLDSELTRVRARTYP